MNRSFIVGIIGVVMLCIPVWHMTVDSLSPSNTAVLDKPVSSSIIEPRADGKVLHNVNNVMAVRNRFIVPDRVQDYAFQPFIGAFPQSKRFLNTWYDACMRTGDMQGVYMHKAEYENRAKAYGRYDYAKMYQDSGWTPPVSLIYDKTTGNVQAEGDAYKVAWYGEGESWITADMILVHKDDLSRLSGYNGVVIATAGKDAWTPNSAMKAIEGGADLVLCGDGSVGAMMKLRDMYASKLREAEFKRSIKAKEKKVRGLRTEIVM